MLRTIGVILSWLPIIISAVTAIEQLIGDGNGAEKKNVALQAIYRVMEKAGLTLTPSLKAAVSSVVDVAVAVLNILGFQGFRDSPDQEAVELMPAVYVDEVSQREVEKEVLSQASAQATFDFGEDF